MKNEEILYTVTFDSDGKIINFCKVHFLKIKDMEA